MGKIEVNRLIIGMLPLFLLMALLSCNQAGEGLGFWQSGAAERADEARVPTAVVTPLPDTAPAETLRAAILLRGNDWITGIAGFDENSFSALYGEYRLTGAEPRASRSTEGAGFSPAGDVGQVFRVYLTQEPMFFSAEWQSFRTGNLQVFQRGGEESFYAGIVLDGGPGAHWTAVFQFPPEMEESGVLNLLIRAWTDRLLYFLSLANAPREVSLPAAVEF